jgi:hypothetical protein
MFRNVCFDLFSVFQSLLYRLFPGYAIILFVKVLLNPNFAKVEIIIAIYVHTWCV